MLLSLISFVSGTRFYKIIPPGKGNVIWKVCKCISYAIKGKISAVFKYNNKFKKKIIYFFRKQDTVEHWLDYALPKYHKNLIIGVKSLVSVSILFIPVVFFWALFDQQVFFF